MWRVPLPSSPRQRLFFCILGGSHSFWRRWYLHLGLTPVSLMDSSEEPFFMPLLAICTRSRVPSFQLPIVWLGLLSGGSNLFPLIYKFLELILCPCKGWQKYVLVLCFIPSICWLFPLLCRNFWMWYNPLCLPSVLFLVPVGFCLQSSCLCLYFCELYLFYLPADWVFLL